MLRGFWNDLWDTARTESAEVLQDKINTQYGSDHITAQNAAVQDMGLALTRFHASGQTSDDAYMAVENQILAIARNFAAYAQTFNTERAIRGASEVTALAKQIVSDLEAERMGTARWGGIGGALSSIPEWVLPVGVVAGAIYFLTPKRKRR